MSDDRKTSVWPWTMAILIGAPVLYVASFGPACRLAAENISLTERLMIIYKPCLDLALDGPSMAREPLELWVRICGGDWYLAIEQERVLNNEWKALRRRPLLMRDEYFVQELQREDGIPKPNGI